MSTRLTDTSSFLLQVTDAQAALSQGRPEDALALCDGVLEKVGDHIDALYCKAVALRLQKRFKDAQGTLRKLLSLQPEFGRAHQDQGHLFREIKDDNAAIAAYERATQLNPALVASWRFLGHIHRERGQLSHAEKAQQAADYWQSQPAEVTASAMHLYEGRLVKAEQLIRGFLQKNQQHVEAMRLLAELAVRFGVMDEAEFLLESAVTFKPHHEAARLDYIQILKRRQKFKQAKENVNFLLEKQPDKPEYINQQAIIELQSGNLDAALKGFDKVLAKAPQDAGVLTSKGHALKTYGQTDKAIAAYQAAFCARPAHGDAYYGLANLKTYRFSDSEINQMRQMVGTDNLYVPDAIPIHFALAKALEDNGDYQTAMQHLTIGNALKRQQSGYSADQMDEEFAAQKAICTPDLFEKQQGHGCQDKDPIFIVGLPRAGSTLIEQILASHSMVDGTLELPNIISLSHGLRGRKRVSTENRYPSILHDLGSEKLWRLGERYMEETWYHRDQAPYFTDKMPNNFRHIGMIALILPNAKIIDARRNAMDCCFSGFKQLFAEGQEFTYSLQDIGRYYRGYVDLMDHWQSVLPGRILRVQHEELVEDPEQQTRRMLDYIGLPFEENCLNFHQTDRAVRTASAQQVRQKINKEGQGRWKSFEPWLSELKQALGPLA